MPVMDIRHMVVGVHQRFVHMMMRMWSFVGVRMVVLVMNVVIVHMLMLNMRVRMFMLVPFAKYHPGGDNH